MLTDLVKRPNKTEISSILIFRRIFIAASLLLLIASFVLLSVKMIHERPAIASTITAVDSVASPGKKLYLLFKIIKYNEGS